MRRWPPLLARWSRRSWSCCLAATSTPTSRTSSRRAGRRATGLFSTSAGSNTTLCWRHGLVAGRERNGQKVSAYALVVDRNSNMVKLFGDEVTGLRASHYADPQEAAILVTAGGGASHLLPGKWAG